MRELQKQHIHIASIQETHIPHDLSYTRNGYRVITTAERKTNSKNINTGMYQGGVAILVHEELQHHIKQIERIDHRILKIIPTNKNATMPITILATYAPHAGYTVEEKTTLESSARNNKKYQWQTYVYGVRMQMGN